MIGTALSRVKDANKFAPTFSCTRLENHPTSNINARKEQQLIDLKPKYAEIE